MNTFKVIVTEDESPDVPGTGIFTAGGFSGISGIWTGIVLLVAVMGVVITMVALKRRRGYSYNNRKSEFRINDKSKKIGGLFLILLITGALIIPLTAGGKKAEQVFADEGDTELGITTSNVELSIKKNESGVSGVYSTYVVTNTNTQLGYKIGLYASTTDLLPTDSSIKTKFAGLDGSGLTTLGDDSWGVSLVDSPKAENSVWLAVPNSEENALILADKNGATPAYDRTNFSFGVMVSPDMEVGTYSTTINYVATAYVNTDEP